MDENDEFAQYNLQRTVQLNNICGDESSNSLRTDEGREKFAQSLIDIMPDDPYFVEVPAPRQMVMRAQLACNAVQNVVAEHARTCQYGCVCSDRQPSEAHRYVDAGSAHRHREQGSEGNETDILHMRGMRCSNRSTSSDQEQERHDHHIWETSAPRSERPRGRPAQRSYARPDASMLFDC